MRKDNISVSLKPYFLFGTKLVGSIQQLMLKVRFNCQPMSSEVPGIIVGGMFFSLHA
jgi:hypothetical protein